jgi:hypothetical protein
MRFVFVVCVLLAGCGPRPTVGITISNTPESIEHCGPRIGGCR